MDFGATTPVPRLAARQRREAGLRRLGPGAGGENFAFLWPNFTLVQNPGQPNAMAFYFRPAGPGRWTVVVSEYLFGPDVAPELVRDVVAFNLLVGAEDQRLVESVQRGMRSDRVTRGRSCSTPSGSSGTSSASCTAPHRLTQYAIQPPSTNRLIPPM